MMIAVVINSSWIILLGQTFAHVLTPCCQLSGKVAHRHFICHLWLLWVERDEPGLLWHNAAKYPLWLRLRLWWSGVITDRVLPDRYLSLSLSLISIGAYSRPDCRERTTPKGRHRQDIKHHSVIVIKHDIRLRDMIRDTLSRVTCLMSWMEWSQLAWLQIET